MTYEMYRYVFLGAAIASGLLFLISVALFFILRVPKIISDLSGRTARRAIENIRMQNERTGNKTYQSSAVNLKRGKLTDRMTPSGHLVPSVETPFGIGKITEKISTTQLPDEDPAGETTVLNEAEETTVLSLDISKMDDSFAPSEFVIETEIMFVHTDEVIDLEGHT